MLSYFLDFMLFCLRSIGNEIFILPLVFIVCTLSISIFVKMGGR